MTPSNTERGNKVINFGTGNLSGSTEPSSAGEKKKKKSVLYLQVKSHYTASVDESNSSCFTVILFGIEGSAFKIFII